MVLSRVAAQKGYLPESLDGTFKITEPYSHLVGAKMAKSTLSIVTPVIFMWNVGASFSSVTPRNSSCLRTGKLALITKKYVFNFFY